jgi:hypothetical protein
VVARVAWVARVARVARVAGSGRENWEVVFTPEAERWLKTLNPRDGKRIRAAVKHLEQGGPSLGRPFVDSIKHSRHHNMKELRSPGLNLRALFAFDPRRRAVVLVGGDKTNDWKGWYARNISRADQVYDRHLRDLGKEGPCRHSAARAGNRSDARTR